MKIRTLLLTSLLYTPLAHAQIDVTPFVANGKIDTSKWYISSGWADGAQSGCVWQSSAITVNADGTLTYTIVPNAKLKPPYACAELQMNTRHAYGIYEARMKAAAGDGLNTAFFTYTGSPWDEIDFEILGKNTKQVQLNYFAGGVGGHEHIVNLGFDASASYHNYKFDWQPKFIRWYVDGNLVWSTENMSKKPGALPSHSSIMLTSLWAGSAQENGWLGAFVYTKPVTANVAWERFEPATW